MSDLYIFQSQFSCNLADQFSSLFWRVSVELCDVTGDKQEDLCLFPVHPMLAWQIGQFCLWWIKWWTDYISYKLWEYSGVYTEADADILENNDYDYDEDDDEDNDDDKIWGNDKDEDKDNDMKDD